MVEVQRLFDDDIVEIDSVFYAPIRKDEKLMLRRAERDAAHPPDDNQT
jgi:hypothetical protein